MKPFPFALLFSGAVLGAFVAWNAHDPIIRALDRSNDYRIVSQGSPDQIAVWDVKTGNIRWIDQFYPSELDRYFRHLHQNETTLSFPNTTFTVTCSNRPMQTINIDELRNPEPHP